MRIAVIGTGRVGSVLGKRWASLGHTVAFGSRDPDSPRVKRLVAACPPGVSAAVPARAARGADVVCLAVPWSAAAQSVAEMGSLSGSILIDATNPLKPDLSGLEVGLTTSAAEQIQAWAPGARVVKALNSTPAENMEDPCFPEGPITMFIAGDDDQAKRVVSGLVSALGFDVCDVGPLAAARLLEPLAMLWIDIAVLEGNRKSGFRLARRP